MTFLLKVFIWLEFLFIVIPSSLGAVFLLSLTYRYLIPEPVFAQSIWEIISTNLVIVGAVLGVVALWAMFLQVIRNNQSSRLVFFGFGIGVCAVLFLVIVGVVDRAHTPPQAPWWVLALRFIIDPYWLPVFVGFHWNWILKRPNNSLVPTPETTRHVS